VMAHHVVDPGARLGEAGPFKSSPGHQSLRD